MTTERFNLRYGKPPMVPAITPHDIGSELDNIAGLASSQPISLIDLCTKASTRSRGHKHSALLQVVSANEVRESSGGASFDAVGQYKPPSRLSILHHSKSKECKWKDDKESLPQSIQQASCPENDGNKRGDVTSETKSNDLSGGYFNKNPLSYSSGYIPNGVLEASNTFGSPFLKSSIHYHSGKESYDRDNAPVSTTAPVYMSTKDHPKASSSLRLYTAHYDNSDHQSPYESFRIKRRNYRSEIPEIMSGLPYTRSEHKDDRYLTIRSEPTLPMSDRGRVVKLEPTLRPHLPAGSVSQTLSTSESNIGVQDTKDSGPQSKKRILKEKICAILSNMNADSEPRGKHTAALQPRPTAREKSPTVRAFQQPNENPVKGLTTLDSHGVREAGAEKQGPVSCRPVLTKESYDKFNGLASANQSILETALSQYIPLIKYGELYNTSRHIATTANKSIRPPPGLPTPVANMAIDSVSALEKAKTDELNVWFHGDGRGEEKMRQHIADIASSYVNGSQDSLTTEQAILLFGNVIANLHSYVTGDCKSQSANFANFRHIDSFDHEQNHGKWRSYFDHDPLGYSRPPTVTRSVLNRASRPSGMHFLDKYHGF